MSDETPGMAAGRTSEGKPTPIVATPSTTSLVRYRYVDPSIRPELRRFWQSLESGFELKLIERVYLPWQASDLEEARPILGITRLGQRIVGVDRWLPRREAIHCLAHEFAHVRGADERTAETAARQFCAANRFAPGRCWICKWDFTAWLRQYEDMESVVQ